MPALANRPPKDNSWAQIYLEDNVTIWNLLHDPEFGLNLAHPDKAKTNDNYVRIRAETKVLRPGKYLRGGKAEHISRECMIGPLPVTCNTAIRKLGYPCSSGMGSAVWFNGRYYDGKRTAVSYPLLVPAMFNVTDISSELLGGVCSVPLTRREKLKEDCCQLEDNSWAMVDYNLEMGVRELEEKFAPQSLDVGGKRHKPDSERKYLGYMNLSF
ncbi:hypothetical protein DL766_004759 [Monosporascus sp. MC13-8B]|uniref:Uncharacterized protein n=1 Tax=Monosporascus cannonballus TaxID=155416 RepID=A0ABY0HLS2_9PEZI|nr:hypothetical protein DL762_000908 [Monosporascus cannonballus]RYO96683.1 hypothetical protein DL763_003059 [Monosporascus cannonballus]RYP30663.1 hypothetical protein DL766_004759 [Monosporascus sp. MC13-8B]